MYNFSTFDDFITSTLGQTIGEGECWDYINLLWSHLGSRYWTYPPSDPSATNHGVKYGWLNPEARNANTITHLSQVTSLNSIKRGDVVIISDGTYGHAGFAKSPVANNRIDLYSQNWSGRLVTLDNISLATFIGGFRYDAWQPTPPTPVITTGLKGQSNFKWAIYARKLREKY